MATLVLAAAGSALGGAVGGSVLGLSGAVIGRAAGATVGQVIDAALLGGGAAPVETGRIDRYRLRGAGEGTVLPRVYGLMRVPGQVIWASRYVEHATTSGGGGKGTPSRPSVTSYSYSVSVALALCEGPVQRIGRVWADGEEIARGDLNLRLYPGDDRQTPDPKIAAVEGAGQAPAFRGTAYVVIEDLDLSQFGNRVPQFSFEVLRLAEGSLAARVPGVALIPGSGEYALSPEPLVAQAGPGAYAALNEHTARGVSDFTAALEDLTETLPNCRAVSLVVSWFGDDLRCGACSIRPKVEPDGVDAQGQPWSVGGLMRGTARALPRLDGASVYGGTPDDASVIGAIRALGAAGQDVVVYPFVLMDQLAGNGLPDPYGGEEQAALPWRGRITLSLAPGQAGSPDRSAEAAEQVAAFFGTARAADFAVSQAGVQYSGPDDWGYRRFVLHNAALCAAAGGVSAFCLGSELRGLTRILDPDGQAPAVAALRDLAAELRALLGPGVRIGYAADWTEYGAYVPGDGSGDVLFPLDPLWADDNIDFIGIDQYAPLSDWRDGVDHADAAAGSIHAPEYLRGNIEGGEGYDWFYPHPADRDTQRRVPIADTAHGEDWIFRAKDLRGWWGAAHHERIGGVRDVAPTDWVPGSKPIWLTEIGCPAVDKGANAPNRFYDPKSSESGLPDYSSGARDDLVQHRALGAILAYWSGGANPVSPVYGGPMIDPARIFTWAWDARPWPVFPEGGIWADGANHRRGHWITGRVSAQELGAVIAEICARAGIGDVDVSGVHGLVRGVVLDDLRPARAHLQMLTLAHGIDVIEAGGRLVFRSRMARAPVLLGLDALTEGEAGGAALSHDRDDASALPDRVAVDFVAGDGSYDTRSVLARRPGAANNTERLDLPVCLTETEGRALAERALTEARAARERITLGLPPSGRGIGPGDILALTTEPDARFRIDKVTETGPRRIEAVRVAEAVHTPSDWVETLPRAVAPVVATPVLPLFLDLPLMTGSEQPEAPHLAISAQPWPGSAAVYASDRADGFALEMVQHLPARVGVSDTALQAADPARIDRGPGLRVRMLRGDLAGTDDEGLRAGANLFAIGDGSPGGWELFQTRDAVLVAPGVYLLTHRLRGLFGSEVEMADPWPVGSHVVALGPEVVQLALSPAQVGRQRHYRIGPASKPFDHASYVAAAHAFSGRGLRPLAPAHLRFARRDGAIDVTFQRRGRIGADRWDLADIPLGEASERYLLRVETAAGAILREVSLTAPAWTWSAAAQAQNGGAAGKRIAVAQVSDTHGPGAFARREINV